MNVLKKASPDRIKELLRIMNFLAAPFGRSSWIRSLRPRPERNT
jgi:hypothetical protein